MLVKKKGYKKSVYTFGYKSDCQSDSPTCYQLQYIIHLITANCPHQSCERKKLICNYAFNDLSEVIYTLI